jgi:hypothetical protein
VFNAEYNQKNLPMKRLSDLGWPRLSVNREARKERQFRNFRPHGKKWLILTIF